ncbi:Electron transfer DM13 [Emticicia oligotrophica DSM 17448]|uniref:Electron transfer DM13 n=1 Tax=Emticicia oligotrophica (strain DSM 17448 / CIP 109782 / MTCC 6937 / GPTSA100-15) TaxID=929562 RepID=A0ABN4ATA0_EMTOG|nr:DM13 domain-containing protein [Emticicia oligotrophica]AFK04681.1 Electron transfer DM13 [Emticicia oligotrophica DSM 17448]
MKIIIALITAVFLAGCQKEDILENPDTNSTTNPMVNSMTTQTNFNTAGQILLLQGNFENAVHATSGIVKIYEDKDKKRTLVFENFKTDAGPDLRIYLAEDRSVTNFIQITDKVQNGNLSLAIPTNADLKKQNHVLIWCRQFSVLFGFAALK